MDEKYIVVKGVALNHKNRIDELSNTCIVCYSWAEAYDQAMCYISNGAMKVQVYKLEAHLEVDKVTVTKGTIKTDVLLPGK